jgi:hypothetical protein
MHQLLVAAWERVRGKVESDPKELARRLARGKRLSARPARGWCLGVRASDRRLWKYCTRKADRKYPNRVVLGREALVELCGPVYLQWPGETLEAVAEKLGVGKGALLHSRLNGVFRVHYVPGARGKQRPLLYREGPLDPSVRGFLPVDRAWGDLALELVGRVPGGIEQVLTREPVFEASRAYHDAEGLHPEDPKLIGRQKKRRDLKLPKPPPDYVWYKWKGEEYMGYDWRNPLAAANWERYQKKLKSGREACKRWRAKQQYQYEDAMQFKGYRWVCPTCGKKVNTVYMPMCGLNLLTGWLGALDEDRRVPMLLDFENQWTFACGRCQRIDRVSRANPDAWNRIVGYLSAGLLYGSEVERPGWFKVERKRAYAARLGAEPSKRRPVIEGMLREGKSYKEIGKELGINWGTVKVHARKIYPQHGVRTRAEFLAKYGMVTARAKLPEIRRRILGGESVGRIVMEMGVKKIMVYNQRNALRAKGCVLRDERERNGGKRRGGEGAAIQCGMMNAE